MELRTAASANSAKTQESESDGGLSKDEIFEILKNQRRRDALQFLRENEGEVKLSDMSEYIAAKENDIEITALSSSQRKRVYIGLYQCHLPKMANFGVIDFDKDRGDISIRPEADLLIPYLDGETPTLETDSRPTLVVAGIVTTAVGLGLVGVSPFAIVPSAGWALVSTLAMIAMAVRESYSL